MKKLYCLLILLIGVLAVTTIFFHYLEISENYLAPALTGAIFLTIQIFNTLFSDINIPRDSLKIVYINFLSKTKTQTFIYGLILFSLPNIIIFLLVMEQVAPPDHPNFKMDFLSSLVFVATLYYVFVFIFSYIFGMMCLLKNNLLILLSIIAIFNIACGTYGYYQSSEHLFLLYFDIPETLKLKLFSYVCSSLLNLFIIFVGFYIGQKHQATYLFARQFNSIPETDREAIISLLNEAYTSPHFKKTI